MPRIPKWAPVEVQWTDAHGGDEWTDDDRIYPHAEDVVTVGQLVDDTTEGVTVALSRIPDRNVVGGYIFIPHPVVRSVKVLK